MTATLLPSVHSVNKVGGGRVVVPFLSSKGPLSQVVRTYVSKSSGVNLIGVPPPDSVQHCRHDHGPWMGMAAVELACGAGPSKPPPRRWSQVPLTLGSGEGGEENIGMRP